MALRTKWDNDIKCQVRGLTGRGPTLYWFPKTRKAEKPMNNIMNYILNNRMSSGSKGLFQDRHLLGHSPLSEGPAQSGTTLTTH